MELEDSVSDMERAGLPIEIIGAALISRVVERHKLVLSTALQPGDQS